MWLHSSLASARPDQNTSHVDEALAFAFGFRTHAAMLNALGQLEHTHLHAQANHGWFALRLQELGYAGTGLDTSYMRALFWDAEFTPHPELLERDRKVHGLFEPHAANDQ
ncbi:MAG: hypothetical protein JWQ22_3123 [Devosia sp.]|nr:hypothetical protein [Devosia sp.]